MNIRSQNGPSKMLKIDKKDKKISSQTIVVLLGIWCEMYFLLSFIAFE